MKKWLIVIAAVTVVAVWQLSLLYEDVFADHMKAEKQAAQIAVEAFDLKSVENVSFYHGNKTWFVVKGDSAEGQTLYVWVPQKKGEPFSKSANEGWSKQKVEQYIKKTKSVKKIIDIHPGFKRDSPIWEINYINTDGRYVIQHLAFNDGTNFGSYSMKQES